MELTGNLCLNLQNLPSSDSLSYDDDGPTSQSLSGTGKEESVALPLNCLINCKPHDLIGQRDSAGGATGDC